MSPPSPQASPRQGMTLQASSIQASMTILSEPVVRAFVCDINENPTTWNEKTGPLFTLLKDSENKACIIFTTMDEFSTNIDDKQQRQSTADVEQQKKLHVERQQKLQQWFPHTPAVFWSKTCEEHNGFFGSHTSSTLIPIPESSHASSFTDQITTSAAADHQELVSTYFRLIVKMLLSAKAQAQGFTSVSSGAADYEWHETGYLSASSDTKNLLLCFDVPADSIANLYQTMPKALDQVTGPFALHLLLLEGLAQLYDRSVWAMAKKVRGIEKQRLLESGRRVSTTSSLSSSFDPSANDTSKPIGLVQLRNSENFEHLFEISRHLAHSVETTQIATEVVERIKNACEYIHLAQGTPILAARVQKLNFLHSLFRGLSARSVSNEKRLTSEQVLLSNVISQRDSNVNKEMSNFSSQIALSAKEDGAAKKTIAVVTLTFLPATFVTALLGMNFFTVDSKTPGGRLTSTKDVWIFFVIAVPLTIIVLCIWWWWQRREVKRHNAGRSEKDVEDLGDAGS